MFGLRKKFEELQHDANTQSRDLKNLRVEFSRLYELFHALEDHFGVTPSWRHIKPGSWVYVKKFKAKK